jgi:hypothetical protein
MLLYKIPINENDSRKILSMEINLFSLLLQCFNLTSYLSGDIMQPRDWYDLLFHYLYFILCPILSPFTASHNWLSLCVDFSNLLLILAYLFSTCFRFKLNIFLYNSTNRCLLREILIASSFHFLLSYFVRVMDCPYHSRFSSNLGS